MSATDRAHERRRQSIRAAYGTAAMQLASSSLPARAARRRSKGENLMGVTSR